MNLLWSYKKSIKFRLPRYGFEFQLCHLLMSYSTSLSLNFLLCKMGLKMSVAKVLPVWFILP